MIFNRRIITSDCGCAGAVHIWIPHLTPLICDNLHCPVSEHTGKWITIDQMIHDMTHKFTCACALNHEIQRQKVNGSHSNVQKLCSWSNSLVSLSFKLFLRSVEFKSGLEIDYGHTIFSSLFCPRHTQATHPPRVHVLMRERVLFFSRAFICCVFSA